MGIVLLHEYISGGGLAGTPLPVDLAAEGSAMRRALAADLAAVPGLSVVMTLDARLPDEPGPWRVERIGPGEERPALARLIEEAEHVALIAPETGGILRERAEWVEVRGARSLGSTPAGIALAGDKRALAERLQAEGIPVPPGLVVRPALGLPGGFTYPAVLKPVDGAGSTDTLLVTAADALLDAEDAAEERLLQPLFDGVPMSVTFLVAADGRAVALGVGRQRIEVVGGEFHYRGGILPDPDRRRVPSIRDLAFRAIRAVPGLRGLVGVDLLARCEDDPRRPWPGPASEVVLEINPRPTTSVVGLCRLLPVGALGAAWIEAACDSRLSRAEGLSRWVLEGDPTIFEADGRILGTIAGGPASPPSLGRSRP